jgi:hypothetical protein
MGQLKEVVEALEVVEVEVALALALEVVEVEVALALEVVESALALEVVEVESALVASNKNLHFESFHLNPQYKNCFRQSSSLEVRLIAKLNLYIISHHYLNY